MVAKSGLPKRRKGRRKDAFGLRKDANYQGVDYIFLRGIARRLLIEV